MQTYISILRGINVGGKRIIKMAALKDLYASLGFTNVETYIQSGNVIFSSKKIDDKKLAAKITAEIETVFGFNVPIVVMSIEELTKTIEANPFAKQKNKVAEYLHVTFLSDQPSIADYEKTKAGNYQADEFHLIEKAIYLYCPNSYSNSKLTNGFFETKLKVTATTRNWKTTNELLAMAKKITS
jgi:uncharacterized protein (DUF1697 family)